MHVCTWDCMMKSILIFHFCVYIFSVLVLIPRHCGIFWHPFSQIALILDLANYHSSTGSKLILIFDSGFLSLLSSIKHREEKDLSQTLYTSRWQRTQFNSWNDGSEQLEIDRRRGFCSMSSSSLVFLTCLDAILDLQRRRWNTGKS